MKISQISLSLSIVWILFLPFYLAQRIIQIPSAYLPTLQTQLDNLKQARTTATFFPGMLSEDIRFFWIHVIGDETSLHHYVELKLCASCLFWIMRARLGVMQHFTTSVADPQEDFLNVLQFSAYEITCFGLFQITQHKHFVICPINEQAFFIQNISTHHSRNHKSLFCQVGATSDQSVSLLYD